MQTLETVADHINKLYNSEFNGKPNGRFRIANSELATLSGRQNISQDSVAVIQKILYEKYDLLLIDLREEVAIIKSGILRRYRKASEKVIEDLLGISPYSADLDDDD